MHWSEELAEDYADFLLGLLPDSARWVHRRVESSQFVDDRSVRVRLSSDLDVTDHPLGPEYAEAVRQGWLPHLVVPLGLFAKQDFVEFDLSSADGSALTLLTRRESTLLVQAVVRRACADALGGRLPADLEEAVLAVVHAGADEGGRALDRLLETAEERPDVARLLADPVVRYLLDALATRFVALVVLDVDGPRRRVLKYGYRSPLRVVDSGLWTRLGLSGFVLEADLPLAGLSGSYHLDLQAPRGLLLDDVVLRRRESTGTWVSVQEVDVAAPAVHLHADDLDDEAYAYAVRLALVPTRRGLVRNATVLAWLTTLLVAVVLVWDLVARGAGGRDTAAALLLLLPGLLGALLSRAGEHPLASRVYLYLRAASLGGSGAALAAGVVVGLFAGAGWVTGVVVAALVACLAVAGLTTTVWWRSG